MQAEQLGSAFIAKKLAATFVNYFLRLKECAKQDGDKLKSRNEIGTRRENGKDGSEIFKTKRYRQSLGTDSVKYLDLLLSNSLKEQLYIMH